MDEVTRTLVGKWGMEPARARRREDELRRHFPEAWVSGYEHLIELMENHPKDRHVLAAAVRSKSELIVTFNRRDFPPSSICQWRIETQGPSTFLRALYDLDSALFLDKLHEQAGNIGVPLARILRSLARNVPTFVQYLCELEKITLI
jgi:hypothetical protein